MRYLMKYFNMTPLWFYFQTYTTISVLYKVLLLLLLLITFFLFLKWHILENLKLIKVILLSHNSGVYFQKDLEKYCKNDTYTSSQVQLRKLLGYFEKWSFKVLWPIFGTFAGLYFQNGLIFLNKIWYFSMNTTSTPNYSNLRWWDKISILI